jgi:hypothetical protein
MVRVRAQRHPDAEQHRQRGYDGCGKHQRNDLRGRSRVIAEYVVDLLLGCVAERLLGGYEGYVGIASDVEVKDLSFVGS